MKLVKKGYTFTKAADQWIYKQVSEKGVEVLISGKNLGELIEVIDKIKRV